MAKCCLRCLGQDPAGKEVIEPLTLLCWKILLVSYTSIDRSSCHDDSLMRPHARVSVLAGSRCSLSWRVFALFVEEVWRLAPCHTSHSVIS